MSGLNEKSRDPSMEDVLASIRKIIAEELDAAHHAVVEDIGPSDHNLPWADEQQSNGQARKTPPVLPIQSALIRVEAPVDPAHSQPDTPVSEAEAEHAEQGSSVLVSDTVVTDEHRAAVAEFEQAIATLPVQDHSSPDASSSETEETALASDAAELSVSPELNETEIAPGSAETSTVEAATHWQSSPFPFDIPSFSSDASADNVESLVPIADDHALSAATDPVEKPQAALYSDFLDAQKPQLNVKLDLSFLQQKFHAEDPAPIVEEPVKQRVEAEPVKVEPIKADPVKDVQDFSVFAADHRNPALPPFIPANVPSYGPLVSQRTTEALLSSLRQLTEATRPQPPAPPVREATLAPRLDEFMADVLRPLLSQWLDANLERIVDQAVRDEIAKFTRSLRP
jgi:cell pole-organizing protein PopZ